MHATVYNPWRFLKVGVILLFAVGAVSTFVYKALGAYYGANWTWLDCLFMVVITLSTIGYGDWLHLPGRPLAMVYTMFLGLAGIGVPAFIISTMTALIIDGTFGNTVRRRRMLQEISNITGHTIVCGAGGLGTHAIDELLKLGKKIVVIDRDAAKLQYLTQMFGTFTYIVGEADRDEILFSAGIQRAEGIIVCLTDDKDNLFVTLSAKMHNPNIKIVSKAIEDHVRKKMLIAGAQSVVSPTAIGGMRMVSELVRPATVSFLDTMMRERVPTRFGELEVGETSPLKGKTLAQANLRQNSDVLIVAAKRPENEGFTYNPAADFSLTKGCVVVVMGSVHEIEKLRPMFAGPVSIETR